MKKIWKYNVFLLLYVLIYYSWMILWKDSLSIGALIENILSLSGIAIALIWVIKILVRNRTWLKTHPTYRFWITLVIGLSTYFLSELAWNYYQFLTSSIPYPSWADYLHLAYYGFLICGLVAVLGKNRDNASYRTQRLNLFVFFISLALVTWVLLLRHVVFDTYSMNVKEILISLGYTVCAPILLFMVYITYISSSSTFPKKSLNIMMVSLLILIFADLIYMYDNSFDIELPCNALSPLWSTSALLLAFSFKIFELNPFEISKRDNRTELRIHLISQIAPLTVLFLLYSYLFFTKTLDRFNKIESALIISVFSSLLLIVFYLQARDSFRREKAIIELHTLNSELEKRVDQRTKVLKEENEEMNNLLTKINHQAYHDYLTGLTNRSFALERMSLSIHKSLHFAVLFLDLDDFKSINDSLGHGLGDKVLQAIARKLKDLVRQEDMVSRLGGDEFVILLDEATSKDASIIASRIIESFKTPLQVSNQEICITPSIGISRFPEDGNDVEGLLGKADIAMYHAKKKGKNNFQFYTPSIIQTVIPRHGS